LRFCHQGIYRIEQGIFGPQETAIDIVTKLSQYVNVHLSKLPFWFDDWNFTQSGRPPQGWGPFVSFSLNANINGLQIARTIQSAGSINWTNEIYDKLLQSPWKNEAVVDQLKQAIHS